MALGQKGFPLGLMLIPTEDLVNHHIGQSLLLDQLLLACHHIPGGCLHGHEVVAHQRDGRVDGLVSWVIFGPAQGVVLLIEVNNPLQPFL